MRTPDSPTLSRYSMAELKRSVDIAYRKWCRRRGLSDHNDFNFRAQVQAGMGEARAEKRAGRPRKGNQDAAAPDPQAAATYLS